MNMIVSEEEYNKALNTIENYKNQFIKLNRDDKLFIGMNFTANINGQNVKCVITDFIKQKCNIDGKSFTVTLIEFEGTYNSISSVTGVMKEYKNTWTLSKSQILDSDAVWAKESELLRKRNIQLDELIP